MFTTAEYKFLQQKFKAIENKIDLILDHLKVVVKAANLTIMRGNGMVSR